MVELHSCVKEYILMLPQISMIDANTHSFLNNYYCVGHSWTERNKNGEFVNSLIDQTMFASWQQDPDETIRNGLIDNL